MKKILVSILSEHAVPNYLFIKEMKGKFDELLFVTTLKVAALQRGRQIEQALCREEFSEKRIEVESDDYQSILSSLSEQCADLDHYYIVNLTGGTKMMSLAVHDFFMKAEHHAFYYIPIGRNVYYSLEDGVEHPITYRMKLNEYLMLYGLRYTAEPEMMRSEEEAVRLFGKVKSRNFYLPDFMFRAKEIYEDSSERTYFSGAWFEEYVYYRIKRELNLGDDYIAKGVKIFRNVNDATNDNELDVVFMHENMLHVIECKVTMYGNDKEKKVKDTVDKYLYKLAAISKDFGLVVNSYLCSLHRFGSDQESMSADRRRRILGIKAIIGTRELSEPRIQL